MKEFISHSGAWVAYERGELVEGEAFKVCGTVHYIKVREDGSAYMIEV
jgi:hypothetical protein